MAEKNGNAFDFKLFRRLLKYTNPYRLTFYLVAFAAIFSSVLSVVRPYLLQETIDNGLMKNDHSLFITLVSFMIGVLLLEVLFQFVFIYFANWLGQHVIRDLRVNLFRHMIQFRQKYFDTSAVCLLYTSPSPRD